VEHKVLRVAKVLLDRKVLKEMLEHKVLKVAKVQ
jgi:hypothetical protein